MKTLSGLYPILIRTTCFLMPRLRYFLSEAEGKRSLAFDARRISKKTEMQMKTDS